MKSIKDKLNPNLITISTGIIKLLGLSVVANEEEIEFFLICVKKAPLNQSTYDLSLFTKV